MIYHELHESHASLDMGWKEKMQSTRANKLGQDNWELSVWMQIVLFIKKSNHDTTNHAKLNECHQRVIGQVFRLNILCDFIFFNGLLIKQKDCQFHVVLVQMDVRFINKLLSYFDLIFYLFHFNWWFIFTFLFLLLGNRLVLFEGLIFLIVIVIFNYTSGAIILGYLRFIYESCNTMINVLLRWVRLVTLFINLLLNRISIKTLFKPLIISIVGLYHFFLDNCCSDFIHHVFVFYLACNKSLSQLVNLKHGLKVILHRSSIVRRRISIHNIRSVCYNTKISIRFHDPLLLLLTIFIFLIKGYQLKLNLLLIPSLLRLSNLSQHPFKLLLLLYLLLLNNFLEECLLNFSHLPEAYPIQRDQKEDINKLTSDNNMLKHNAWALISNTEVC